MVRRGLCSFVLVLMFLTAPSIATPLSAEDTNPSEEPTKLVAKPSADAAETYRAVWAMVGILERHHVDAPERQTLLGMAVSAIRPELDEPRLRKSVEEVMHCRDATEFANALKRESPQLQQSPPAFENVVAAFSKALAATMGPISLTSQKEHQVQEQLQNNRYVGIGVSIANLETEEFATFPSVAPGGPASRAGLKQGTVLYAVDDLTTKGASIRTIVDAIRGPAGSELTLVVSDGPNVEKRSVKLRRGVVRFDALLNYKNQPLSQGGLQSTEHISIGWIRFRGLSGSALSELRIADSQARADGLKVMVLDLTGPHNTDDLHLAAQIADSLIDGGTMWTIHQRNVDPQVLAADRDCLFRGIPLVALVDASTDDSAAAIAAALQDSGRAVIVGQSPNCSGTISQNAPLPDLPYVMSFRGARIDRARQGRKWPLIPNEVVATPQPDVTVFNQQQVEVVHRRRLMTVSGNPIRPAQEPVSALQPVNVPMIAAVPRRPSAKPSQARTIPIAAANSVPERGMAVARRLLEKTSAGTISPPLDQ